MDLIVVTQSFLVVDLGGKGLVDNPALCELLNKDVASLEGWNFRNKSCVTYSSCSYHVLVDLVIVLSRSMFVCCSFT